MQSKTNYGEYKTDMKQYMIISIIVFFWITEIATWT